MTRGWGAVLVAVASMSGCVAPAAQPSMSFARYLLEQRTPVAGAKGGTAADDGDDESTKVSKDSGQVSVHAGLAIVDILESGSGASVLFPVVEGALALRVAEIYGAAVTLSNGKMSVEGMVMIGSEKIGLGLIHGVGVGMVSTLGGSGGDNTVLFLDLTLGVIVQAHLGRADLFTGFKYTFTSPAGTTSGWSQMHWFGGSIGAGLPVGPLYLAGEVILAGANQRPLQATGAAASEGYYFFFMPMLTVAAPF